MGGENRGVGNVQQRDTLDTDSLFCSVLDKSAIIRVAAVKRSITVVRSRQVTVGAKIRCL